VELIINNYKQYNDGSTVVVRLQGFLDSKHVKVCRQNLSTTRIYKWLK